MITAMTLLRGRALIAASRQISTTTARSEIHPGYFKFKEQQKAFQVDNGLRIHERGGPKDKILYNVTLLIGAVIGVQVLELMYRGMFPKGLIKGIFGDKQ